MHEGMFGQPYLLMALMHMSGILAFCLHKIGHGRIEDKRGLLWGLAMLAAAPLIPVAGLGLIAATIWGLVALSWWKVLLLVVGIHLLWSAVVWYVLGHIRASGHEDILHALGIPLVLSLRFVCAATAILLLIGLWRGYWS